MTATHTAIQHAPAKRGDLTAVARRIDEVSGAAVELFKQAGSFEREIALVFRISPNAGESILVFTGTG